MYYTCDTCEKSASSTLGLENNNPIDTIQKRINKGIRSRKTFHNFLQIIRNVHKYDK